MVRIAERIIPRKLIEKYRSFPVTLRAALWFTVCNFILKGISFICMPIYSHVLSEEEYRKYFGNKLHRFTGVDYIEYYKCKYKMIHRKTSYRKYI